MAKIRGQKPISKRAQAVKVIREMGQENNKLTIPQEIMADLEAKGLEARFIEYKKYAENGNFHGWGWVPYKCDNISPEMTFGVTPDGHFRRDDLILAVRDKNKIGAKHRSYLEARRNLLSNSAVAKDQAKSLKQTFNDAGKKVEVVEGYEDNG